MANWIRGYGQEEKIGSCLVSKWEALRPVVLDKKCAFAYPRPRQPHEKTTPF